MVPRSGRENRHARGSAYGWSHIADRRPGPTIAARAPAAPTRPRLAKAYPFNPTSSIADRLQAPPRLALASSQDAICVRSGSLAQPICVCRHAKASEEARACPSGQPSRGNCEIASKLRRNLRMVGYSAQIYSAFSAIWPNGITLANGGATPTGGISYGRIAAKRCGTWPARTGH